MRYAYACVSRENQALVKTNIRSNADSMLGITLEISLNTAIVGTYTQ